MYYPEMLILFVKDLSKKSIIFVKKIKNDNCMNKHLVSIAKYRKKIKSVQRAIDLSDTFQNLSGNESVFLKPNIVFSIVRGGVN